MTEEINNREKLLNWFKGLTIEQQEHLSKSLPTINAGVIEKTKNNIPQDKQKEILERYNKLTKEQQMEVTQKIREIKARKFLDKKMREAGPKS